MGISNRRFGGEVSRISPQHPLELPARQASTEARRLSASAPSMNAARRRALIRLRRASTSLTTAN